MMVLKPGQSTGEPDNEHPNSEQWLFVVSGSGEAKVNRRRVRIGANSLLVIEANEVHQVTNTGKKPLITLNVYVPPAYDDKGEVLLRAKGLARAVADAVRGE
jgi:mannose-6-phosphate isomerase-like protein (cupin superfamily)